MLKQALCKSFAIAGGDRLAWRFGARGLRILCYHGICDDRLNGEPWVPGYFVTASAFEQQLRYLQRNACVLPLSAAAAHLADGSLPPRATCLTFDDGYANNLSLAHPLLEKYRSPATVFLSSAYIESGDMYPFLKLHLIRLSGVASGNQPPVYKSDSLDAVAAWTARWWPVVEKNLTADQRRTLRPLTVEEVRAADPQWMEFGAHSHTHCILKNESRERRQAEIVTSIDKVAAWTGRPVRLFSYPNGEPGDFDATDQQTLRAQGILAAVTGIGGTNGRQAEMMALKRYPVGMYHDAAGFQAEVTGFRNAVLAAGKGFGL